MSTYPWTRTNKTDSEQFHRDLLVAMAHPDYDDMSPLDALRELRRERGEYT